MTKLRVFADSNRVAPRQEALLRILTGMFLGLLQLL